MAADTGPGCTARHTPPRRQPAHPAEITHPPICQPRRHTPRQPTAAKRFTIRIHGTGDLVGELASLQTAHRIAHCYLGEWPDWSPLAVADRERGHTWHVRPGACSPPSCDLAPDLAEAAETRTEHAHGNSTTGEQTRAPFGHPPIPQAPAPARPAATAGGLPIRVPTTTRPTQAAGTAIDPALLRRVLDRLRRL